MFCSAQQSKFWQRLSRRITIFLMIVFWGSGCSHLGGLSFANADHIGTVSVANGRLFHDGEPWIPQGVVIVGRLLPKKPHGDTHFEPLITAAENFGPAELEGVRKFGADLIRLQVSQPALNPSSNLFDPDYINYVVSGVTLARSMGFAVLISMQWEPGSGSYHEKNMPEIETQNAWTTLIKALPHDNGIMLELFNEPGLDETSAANWQIWHDDHQALITHIRQLGAKNVLVVDGLHGGAVITTNAPAIHDPLSEIVYALHPYFNPGKIPYGPPHWDQYFGNFCASHACLVSEWNAGTFAGCINDIPSLSNALLSYLRNKQIGLVAWAFDYHNTLMMGNSYTVTNDFKNFTSCTDNKTIYGPGALLKSYFSD